jgi:hypothetical protein
MTDAPAPAEHGVAWRRVLVHVADREPCDHSAGEYYVQELIGLSVFIRTPSSARDLRGGAAPPILFAGASGGAAEPEVAGRAVAEAASEQGSARQWGAVGHRANAPPAGPSSRAGEAAGPPQATRIGVVEDVFDGTGTHDALRIRFDRGLAVASSGAVVRPATDRTGGVRCRHGLHACTPLRMRPGVVGRGSHIVGRGSHDSLWRHSHRQNRSQQACRHLFTVHVTD